MVGFDALSVQSIQQYQKLLQSTQNSLKYHQSVYVRQYNAMPSVILSLIYTYLSCLEAIRTVRGCSKYYNSVFHFAAAQHWKQWEYRLKLTFQFGRYKISQLHCVFGSLQRLTLDLSSILPTYLFEISLCCPVVRYLTLDKYSPARHPWLLSKLKSFTQVQEISIEVIGEYDHNLFESLYLFDYNQYKSIEINLETDKREFGWSNEQGKLLNNHAIPLLKQSLIELRIGDPIITHTTLDFFSRITSLKELSLVIQMEKVYPDHENITPYPLTELRTLVNLNDLELQCTGTGRSFRPEVDFGFLDSLTRLHSLTLEHAISYPALCLLLKSLPNSTVEQLQFSSLEWILLQHTIQFHQTASNCSKLSRLSVDEIYTDNVMNKYGIQGSDNFLAFCLFKFKTLENEFNFLHNPGQLPNLYHA